ncbi:prolipoprotein diacylglyceryl transferase [Euryhalocaulis sp.]|uniref:prolipoprotein diacylglyceryl transferase n=1 Tax=Euryhalocaulis sp. TaxID=2744307 RepID=UPI00257D9D5C|nr:prolipoprotein diacylglyceryl transferase [Euryhalocaulis sp.]
MIEAGLPFPEWLQPNIFTIGPVELFGREWAFPLRWYALAYIAGLLLGWRYVLMLVRRDRLWTREPGAKGKSPISPEAVDDMFIWAVVGVIAGGRLGYVLFYDTSLIWTNPLQILMTWQGGMSFHGGLIGVGLAIWFFARSRGIGVLRLADLFAAATPIGLFFGRIANFVNGELWGRQTDLPWAIRFPAGDYVPRHPSQLYEALMEGLILFAVIFAATWRFKSLSRPGMNTGLFLVGYGVSRILLEFVRAPDEHMQALYDQYTFGITMGMMLSVPMALAGLWLIRLAFKTPAARATA